MESLKGKLEKGNPCRRGRNSLTTRIPMAPFDLLVKVVPETIPKARIRENFAVEGTPFCHHFLCFLLFPLIYTYFFSFQLCFLSGNHGSNIFKISEPPWAGPSMTMWSRAPSTPGTTFSFYASEQ